MLRSLVMWVKTTTQIRNTSIGGMMKPNTIDLNSQPKRFETRDATKGLGRQRTKKALQASGGSCRSPYQAQSDFHPQLKPSTTADMSKGRPSCLHKKGQSTTSRIRTLT